MDSARKAEIRARAELTAFTVIGGARQMLEPNTVYAYVKKDDIADLLAEVERLAAQIAAVTRLHLPWSVYGECGHGHTEESGNVKEIDDIGLTCAHEYDVCESCCTANGESMLEICIDHDHGPGKPICATIAALAAEKGGDDA